MNRNENEAESFAGNFMAFGEEALFFEVPLGDKFRIQHLSGTFVFSRIALVVEYPQCVRQNLL